MAPAGRSKGALASDRNSQGAQLPGGSRGFLPPRGRRPRRSPGFPHPPPPHRPAGVNKAAIRVPPLTGNRRPPWPRGPSRPVRAGPGRAGPERCDEDAAAEEGAVKAARATGRRRSVGPALLLSGGAVPAAPEVLGAVASLPARGRPAIVPGSSAAVQAVNLGRLSFPHQPCSSTPESERVGRALGRCRKSGQRGWDRVGACWIGASRRDAFFFFPNRRVAGHLLASLLSSCVCGMKDRCWAAGTLLPIPASFSRAPWEAACDDSSTT